MDVGSTTIAAHLTDLRNGTVKASAGVMNPQIRFGEDLMSRVSYAMMNPGGAAEMTAAVRDARVADVALTRVAPEGNLVVNSSRGGGAKDTVRDALDGDRK